MKRPTRKELITQLELATARIDFLQKSILGIGTKRVLDVTEHVKGSAVFVAISRQAAEVRGVFLDESQANSIAQRQALDVEAWQVQFYADGEVDFSEPLRYYIGQRVKYNAKREGLRGTGTIIWSDDDSTYGNDKICYKIARDGLTSVPDGDILIYGLEIEGVVK